MLAAALRVADLLSRLLPVRAQYAVADLAGEAWYRAAPRRRRLVAANLGRVLGHVGGEARRGAPAPSALVRSAFREHARYYLELLRAPRYPVSRITEIIRVDAWETIRQALGSGPAVFVTAHLGNFEPVGHFLSWHGIAAVAPVEEIEPPALYAFLLARRGASSAAVETVPLSRGARPLIAALRRGRVAALVADRDLDGGGLPIRFFGHPTTMPVGPATLALIAGVPLLTGRALRIGPDRFEGHADALAYTATGDRTQDVMALTERVTRNLERYIAERPEQWWGAFQPIWPDLR